MVRYCISTYLPCTAEEYMVLKDDPAYVAYQLSVVGAQELSRTSELGADGVVTQTIVNRPNVSVPRIVRPLLGGKEIVFRDVRRWANGAQLRLPFELDLTVTNSISERVSQNARVIISNARVDADGRVLGPAPPNEGGRSKHERRPKNERSNAAGVEEGADPDAMEDPVVSSSSSEAARVAAGAVGPRCCEIRVVGEVIFRLGPFSRKAEEVTVSNMRRAYERFPGIVAEWKRKQHAGHAESVGDSDESRRTSGEKEWGPSPMLPWWKKFSPELIRASLADAKDGLLGTLRIPGTPRKCREGRSKWDIAARRAFEKISYPDDEYLF